MQELERKGQERALRYGYEASFDITKAEGRRASERSICAAMSCWPAFWTAGWLADDDDDDEDYDDGDEG
eukprot:15480971-Heterocapsa_arctica.AAC.1